MRIIAKLHGIMRSGALLCGLFAGISLSVAADGSKVRVGTEGTSTPWTYYDSAGKLTGVDVDIVTELCRRIKATCEFVTLQYDGMIPALQGEKIDLIASSMNITDKRKKVVDFTDKIYSSFRRFITCSDKKLDDVSPAGLKGLILGTQQATTTDDYLEAFYKDSEVRLYKSFDDAFTDMAAGRLDAVLANEIKSYFFLQTDAGKGCRLLGERLNNPQYFGYGVGLGLRKSDPDLRDRLNAALKEMIADGTHARITQKYFPFSIY